MIWCVEDDASIRDIEVYALESTGFESRGFDDGAAFWEALKEEQPEIYAKTERFLQAKDYLVYRLCGNMDSTDLSDASHGMLMNLETREYDREMFRNVGLDVGKFPELHSG